MKVAFFDPLSGQLLSPDVFDLPWEDRASLVVGYVTVYQRSPSLFPSSIMVMWTDVDISVSPLDGAELPTSLLDRIERLVCHG